MTYSTMTFGSNPDRINVIKELMVTEKTYLDNLEVVRDIFINKMLDKNILAKDESEIIFINWNDLLLCSNRLFK